MASALESFLMIDHENKIAILGDMLELGKETNSEHEKIIHYCENNQINYLTVGGYFAAVTLAGKSFLSTDEISTYLSKSPLKDALILLKGSRGIALEKLLPLL